MVASRPSRLTGLTPSRLVTVGASTACVKSVGSRRCSVAPTLHERWALVDVIEQTTIYIVHSTDALSHYRIPSLWDQPAIAPPTCQAALCLLRLTIIRCVGSIMVSESYRHSKGGRTHVRAAGRRVDHVRIHGGSGAQPAVEHRRVRTARDASGESAAGSLHGAHAELQSQLPDVPFRDAVRHQVQHVGGPVRAPGRRTLSSRADRKST